VLAALSPADQRLCRALFLRLCTPERTRAAVRIHELYGLSEDASAVAQVVRHLAGARLVLLDGSCNQRGGTMGEVCHEGLIERWTRLKQWLDEHEQDAEHLARIRVAAQQWEASGGDEGLLWRDRAAEDAEAWLSRRNVALSSGEERFLKAVVALAKRSRRV